MVLTALVMYVSGIQRCSSLCCSPYPCSVTIFSCRGSIRNIQRLSVHFWDICRSRFNSILAKFREDIDMIVTSTSTSTLWSALFLYLGDMSRHLILQQHFQQSAHCTVQHWHTYWSYPQCQVWSILTKPLCI